MRTYEFTCSRCGKLVEELDPSPDSPGGSKPDICSACLKVASQSMGASPPMTAPASPAPAPSAPPPAAPKPPAAKKPPARSGNTFTLTFKSIPLCKKCRGTGKFEGLVCPVCAGTGTKPR
ncbi:MAG: hypothetical protein WC728_17845 [Elusimicrobiota bacterium]